MDHRADGQPPAEDISPYLPTEDAFPHLPTDGAFPYLPTEGALPYPPAQAGPRPRATPHGFGDPAAAGPSYAPTSNGAGGQPAGNRSANPAPGLSRYGPGVPVAPQAGTAPTAERVWRTGHLDVPPRRPRRWRGLASASLTVILVVASAVILFLRSHHAPFHVTGVAITQQTKSGCGVDVTGKISTNGAAGTVSYQWLFVPDQQAPQPLSQSVTGGQDAVFVTVTVQGSGHGSASRAVTLQVLGPDSRTASTSVALRC
jgi:hypothetical protein